MKELKMKKNILFVFILFISIFVLTGCKDRTEITAPQPLSPISGTADLTRFVTIGNSITAGYQSSSLYEGAQVYSFGNLIAQQVNTTFAMPLISGNGIGGKLVMESLQPPSIKALPLQSGAPINLTYPAPYNNLGIPGALLYDVMNATNKNNCASALFANKPNDFFDIVLRNQGSQFQQAKALNPTFVTLWIGNNDVLGFATSGGFSPSAPTPTSTFTALYNNLAANLDSLAANVVVANIPSVTDIPFFTTVGPGMALAIPWALLRAQLSPGLFYQKHGEIFNQTSFIDSVGLLHGTILVTLPAQSYAALLGLPTGKWYVDNHYPALPAGIDTTKPFGFHPQNPLPDALVLDESEIATANSATNDYNVVIQAAANTYGFGLVDINTVFKTIRSRDYNGGTVYGGVVFTTSFVTGGLFSLDGVHPSSQGHGVIANEFLKVINSKFGASFPLVDIGKIPGSISFSKNAMPIGIPTYNINNWWYFTL